MSTVIIARNRTISTVSDKMRLGVWNSRWEKLIESNCFDRQNNLIRLIWYKFNNNIPPAFRRISKLLNRRKPFRWFERNRDLFVNDRLLRNNFTRYLSPNSKKRYNVGPNAIGQCSFTHWLGFNGAFCLWIIASCCFSVCMTHEICSRSVEIAALG